MKVKIILFAFFSCLIMLGMGSCEGDKGDIGLAGPQGPEGPQGPFGQNGVENCMDCHGNSQLITAKLFQWESSVHATGGHYERNNASCAACHTSQGFLDRIASGEMAASMDIEDPLPQNCYACHQIHKSYTDEDWEFTAGDPVALWVGGETIDLGKANLCINCHQSRVPTPGIPPVGETAVYNITNKRYGPHHGSQGAVFTGSSAYLVGNGYENSPHTALVENACITCHMAPIMGGNEAGGHTFRVASEDGELNTAGCVACHSDTDVLETLYATTQSDVSILLDSLGNMLKDLGLLDDNLTYAVVPQDFTSLRLGILWNYQYVKEDRSLGVHNAKFVKTLLGNSIEALE
jgi:formate-dependent nitrite reductase cytochrome c552 subunit